jgi:DNA-directed RNA polymerase II subunit RPB1
MSKLKQELLDVNNVKSITQVQFGLLDPDLMRAASVVEVTLPDTYEGTEPKDNGLMDTRMGVIEKGRVCPVDEYDHTITPGYFGHIELPLPVYWIQHVDTITKLLRCVCVRCSSILIDKSDAKLMREIKKRSGEGRFKYIVELCTKNSNKKCINEGCYADQPVMFRKLVGDKLKEKATCIQIEAEFKPDSLKDAEEKKKKVPLTPKQIYNIFKRITPDNVNLLGFNNKFAKPEWLLCTVLPVSPPAARPSVRQDNNQRAEDDITAQYSNILKAVRSLKKAIEKNAEKKTINILHGLLQYHIATLVDNEIKDIPVAAHRSGRPLKVIRQRLKGKEGRLRMNLMGKRSDFSARTVIGVDPNISIDEYGVPEKIAMNLTIPERVTNMNINKLYKMVRNGPHNYPGAKQITKMNYDENGRPNPETISLKYIDRNTIILEEGDVVDRHVIDGDVALFNRQPSLHRMSMMGHKIKVMKGLTFRLNVFVCAPYNADFDGDEMNMHLPQNIETSYELQNITMVPNHIISPAKLVPIIVVVQDSMTAAYLFTQPFNKIDKRLINNLMMSNHEFNGLFPEPKEDGKWTGQDVFSMIMPDISVNANNNAYDDYPSEKNHVVIKNGKFENGVLDKKFLGGSNSSLVYSIYNTFGPETTKNFLNNTQRILTRWMTANGFSLGIGDAVAKKSTTALVEKVVQEKIQEVNTLIKKANQGTYNPSLDQKFIFKSLEQDIIGVLNKAMQISHKEVKKTISEFNRFNVTVTSGAKGNKINIGQIMAVVGQQSVEGQRVGFGYTKRTLPHFSKDDYGAESRGFVKNSFSFGLSPIEVFFHLMGGRTGLIDTSIKTAESGYIQRRLIKAMEDLVVKYDGTVRNAVNNIVQFTYGDDSIDPTRLEKLKLPIMEKNDEQLEKDYLFNENDIESLKTIMEKDAYDELVKEKDYVELLKGEYERIYNFRKTCREKYFANLSLMDTTIYLPVNLYRVINIAKERFHVKNYQKTDLTPQYINHKIEKLLERLNEFVPQHSLKLFEMMVYTYLSPKVSIMKERFSRLVFDYIIDNVQEKFITSLVQPGEMVGILAAQSVGETTTQMTLNTFHYAGVGSSSVVTTSGVPRMKEIVNVAKTIKTPSLSVYLRDEYSSDIAKAKEIKSQLVFTKMEEIVEKTQIIYENNEGDVSNDEDIEFIKTYQDFADLIGYNQCPQEKLSKWVLRIEFNKEDMMNHNIFLSDIQEIIMRNSSTEDNVQCIFSDDNAGNLIMRIRIIDEQTDEDYLSFLQELEKTLMSITIRGIPNIDMADVGLNKKLVYTANGGYQTKDEWCLQTEGVNLIDTLLNSYVDETRTTSNDINEVLDE